MTEEEELHDAYIDWFAFNEEMWVLEERGYRHVFFGHDLDESMGGSIGNYVLVKDEFPPGDLVFVEKLIRPSLWRELGLTPISIATRKDAKMAVVLSQIEEDGAIELYSERFKWAAAVHPCARPGCEWQGSMFDQYGPHGHVEDDTRVGALRQLFERVDDWVVDPGVVDKIVKVATEHGQFRHPLRPRWEENPADKPYQLVFALVIDHPELRSPSMDKSIPPGKVQWTRWNYSSQKAAVSDYEGMLAGEFDFASEFIRSVEVIKMNPEGGIDRVVRRKKERRERGDDFLVINPEDNPPFSGWREGWWREEMPHDVTKIAYRRKRDALNVFMDWNGPLIDQAFNGPSQKHPHESFDNFNAAHGLKGKRRVTTFAKAVWFALPAGGPYHLEDIDVNALNDTQPMIHNAEEQLLRIPDYAEERRLVDLEAAYWEKYADLLPEDDDAEVPF